LEKDWLLDVDMTGGLLPINAIITLQASKQVDQ